MENQVVEKEAKAPRVKLTAEEAKANLMEKMREFDAKLKLDREKLNLDREKAKTDAELKRKALNKKPQTSK